jgi:hypothetical protein
MSIGAINPHLPYPEPKLDAKAWKLSFLLELYRASGNNYYPGVLPFECQELIEEVQLFLADKLREHLPKGGRLG